MDEILYYFRKKVEKSQLFVKKNTSQGQTPWEQEGGESHMLTNGQYLKLHITIDLNFFMSIGVMSSRFITFFRLHVPILIHLHVFFMS